MRKYEETHPWIDFNVDLSALSVDFWMLIGEAKSKCDHIAQVPLRDDIARDLYTLYLAKGVHATTAIEGNTLTEDQVREHIQGELDLPDSQQYLEQEIDNIVAACNVIEREVMGGTRDGLLRVEDIHEYNRMALKGLQLEEGVVPGEIRQHPVTVGNVYRGAPQQDCEFLLNKMCDWLNNEQFMGLYERFGVGASLLRAILAHLYVAWIHPFGDGNGRTARLIEFHLLVSSGVPSPSAQLLSNHYNATRQTYYRKLREASQNGGDPGPFIYYGVEGFVDGVREQITLILERYLRDLVWRDLVDIQDLGKTGDVVFRRKELLVELFRARRPIKKSMVPSLSTELAAQYAAKTRKTLSRDLNALEDAGLIRQTPKGYAPRRDLILRFLPPRTDLPGRLDELS